MLPKDIDGYINTLNKTKKKIGFHPHNGLQLAFANTLEAMSKNIDIVDGTVYGIGRGAGNLPLEALITYLEKNLKDKKYNAMPILDIIDRYFIQLKEKVKWGYNLAYMLSGILEVHPNYVSKLVGYHEYSVDDIVKTLEAVKEYSPIGYKEELIDKILASGFVGGKRILNNEGENSEKECLELSKEEPVVYVDRYVGRDFLILANGPTLKEHSEEIRVFTNIYNPVVMGANYLGDLFVPHYHAFSNKKRFIKYIDKVSQLSKLLISSSFEEDFVREYTDMEYEKIVHLDVSSNIFDITNGVISSNCRTVSILLIAVAVCMGAKRIFIAGMDGYKGTETFSRDRIHFYEEKEEAENFKMLMEKHNWNENFLNQINKHLIDNGKEGLHIITPTNHKHFYNSIDNWVKEKDE